MSLGHVEYNLPLLIDGIETDVDRRLLDYFVHAITRILTLINDNPNPFNEIPFPMATQHQGLMHSLMCIIRSHLSELDPEPAITQRKLHHLNLVKQDLEHNVDMTSKSSRDEPQFLVEVPIIASIISLALKTIGEGETEGEYRPHMDPARSLLVNQ